MSVAFRVAKETKNATFAERKATLKSLASLGEDCRASLHSPLRSDDARKVVPDSVVVSHCGAEVGKF
jgi:hypothetical protein